mmetsp:Transcript_17248/g.19429  ORF Transcript_17248/g.19429 Transcript_17248/m.19429 type:complete len:209 (-) Transcript_17248:50-676(-)
MLTHPLFDNFSNVFQRLSQLLHLIVAQGNIVGKITLIANHIEGLFELLTRFIELVFLVKDATFAYYHFSVFGNGLFQHRFGELKFILFIFNRSLQHSHPVNMFGVIDLLASLQSLVIVSCLEQGLCIIHPIFFDFWVVFHQQFIVICGNLEILKIVIAVSKQGQSSTTSRIVLKFGSKNVNHLIVFLVLDQGVYNLGILAIRNLSCHI